MGGRTCQSNTDRRDSTSWVLFHSSPTPIFLLPTHLSGMRRISVKDRMLNNPNPSNQTTPKSILSVWFHLDKVVYSQLGGTPSRPSDRMSQWVKALGLRSQIFRLPATDSGCTEAMGHPPLTNDGPFHTVGLLGYLLKVRPPRDRWECIAFYHATFSKQPCWPRICWLGIQFLSILLRNPVGAFQLPPFESDMEYARTGLLHHSS